MNLSRMCCCGIPGTNTNPCLCCADMGYSGFGTPAGSGQTGLVFDVDGDVSPVFESGYMPTNTGRVSCATEDLQQEFVRGEDGHWRFIINAASTGLVTFRAESSSPCPPISPIAGWLVDPAVYVIESNLSAFSDVQVWTMYCCDGDPELDGSNLPDTFVVDGIIGHTLDDSGAASDDGVSPFWDGTLHRSNIDPLEWRSRSGTDGDPIQVRITHKDFTVGTYFIILRWNGAAWVLSVGGGGLGHTTWTKLCGRTPYGFKAFHVASFDNDTTIPPVITIGAAMGSFFGARRSAPVIAKPLARDQWPALVKAVAAFAVPKDKGVGDTLTRLIDAGGGGKLAARFPTVANLFGKFMLKYLTAGDSKAAFAPIAGGCNCRNRRTWCNLRYPYRT